ncbi:DUF58 domain-containing protein [Cocleimonas flava]|uniref:Uncharacterized protein DUF58 n=1 Tax=Cocleimonas flava TaxID=634765 RepID=A0A4R1F3L5_9GAMM|nr:DUF58 domain-containing protein [Cocleimonas flava]TCJ88846.1 uncharacterized protein DUF58 [Cocleimonas flava]
MSLLNRWFQGLKRSEAEQVESALVGTGTHITAKELISLQQQAHKLDMSRRSYARSSTTGTHHSSFRGRGMDYQESRIYQAGDDIRNMDWRVTARAGQPHTKLYQEERERPVVLLVDFNPGMFFGSIKSLKSVVAAKAATLIAWSVASRGDRIGALIINSSHHELPPKTGKRGVLQLIRELVKHSDPVQGLSTEQSHTSLNDELKRLRRIARPGSLVFLISDFYDIDQDTANHIQFISRHSDIQLIQVVDPLEMVPPPPARYAITNGEDTGMLNTRSKKGREDFREFISQHHQDIQQLARKYNLSLIQLSTADDVLLELQRNFGNSKRRKPMSSSLDVHSEGKAQESTQEKTPISGGVTSTKSTNASRTSNNSKVA